MLRLAKCSQNLSKSGLIGILNAPNLRISGTVTKRTFLVSSTDCSKRKKPFDGTNYNKEVLKSHTTTTSCHPVRELSSQPPSGHDDNKSKYLLAALVAGIGGIGLAYYLNGDDSTSTTTPVSGAKTDIPAVKRVPASPDDIPKEVPYLLIGGGTASFTAFRAIKSNEPKAKVLVISNEAAMPYMRPPLSKEMWFNNDPAVSEKLRFKQWNGAERSLFYEPDDFYVDPKALMTQENGGVAVCRGYQVVKLDIPAHKAILDDGTEIRYGKVLIATGARPRNLEVFEKASPAVKQKLSYYKSVSDFKNLQKIVDKSSSIAVIGGGFLGSELSVALSHYGKSKKLNVHQVFTEKGNMGKVLPEYLSQWTTERVKEEGVDVLASTEIKSVEVQDKKLKIELNNGRTLIVDHAIVAVGSEPNTDLAKSSGLEVDKTQGGFVVNAELEARHDVFVAGDASCFYDMKLGRRRVEHHDHAVVSGRLAGENMVGLHKPFTHQSMFWSDLGPKVGYEAIGICDASLPTTGVFARESPSDTPAAANMEDKLQATTEQSDKPTTDKKPEATPAKSTTQEKPAEKDDFGKGVIFYLNENDRVVGILLWNVFNRISIARKILAQDTKYDDLNEVAKLFDLYDIQDQGTQ
ncbi:apoptosis-inducing factor 1, mitochondrial [Culicoides brevitarsis]|uniref:apoptosis-inducing factor 1, mitochondrial n=1 Tax=Culicoides brevitarsis TaxID=469753 RepID=UPI00307C180B